MPFSRDYEVAPICHLVGVRKIGDEPHKSMMGFQVPARFMAGLVLYMKLMS